MRRSVAKWNAAFMRQNGVPEEICPEPTLPTHGILPLIVQPRIGTMNLGETTPTSQHRSKKRAGLVVQEQTPLVATSGS